MKNKELRGKFEEIMDVMDNFAFDHEEIEKRALLLDTREHLLRASESELDLRKTELDTQKEEIEAEREAVKKQAEQNLILKAENEKNKESRKRLGELITQSEEQEKKTTAEIALLDIKKKEFEDLQNLQKDIEKREALLNKEKAIIRESNRILDIRKKNIAAREKQLQIESTLM